MSEFIGPDYAGPEKLANAEIIPMMSPRRRMHRHAPGERMNTKRRAFPALRFHAE
jgi:hypothetical protein